MAAPIPFTVIGGYLGAGKTTLVNRVLSQDHGRRLAVIVNDFGEVALDEQLIRSDDGEITALANGCVCCTLSDGFVETLTRLRGLDPRPDQVVVEVSGVSDPWAVAQWGRSPGYELDGVVVVVDPDSVQRRAVDPYVGDTVVAQIRSGDLVLVSRADVVDTHRLVATAHWVMELTNAPVLTGTDQPLEVLLGLDTRGQMPEHLHADHVGVHFTPTHIELEGLQRWLEAAPSAVVRVKGTARSSKGRLVAQRVGTRCEVVVADTNSTYPPMMTVVATPEVDRKELESWTAAFRSPVQ